jgi:molybdopterin-guanine dinucleotide biosynthesis protein A
MSRDMKIENSEPLHSIYKKDNLDIISKLLEDDNLYVKSFIKNLKCVNFVEVDNEVLFEDDFKNFNRKEDIESFE